MLLTKISATKQKQQTRKIPKTKACIIFSEKDQKRYPVNYPKQRSGYIIIIYTDIKTSSRQGMQMRAEITNVCLDVDVDGVIKESQGDALPW